MPFVSILADRSFLYFLSTADSSFQWRSKIERFAPIEWKKTAGWRKEKTIRLCSRIHCLSITIKKRKKKNSLTSHMKEKDQLVSSFFFSLIIVIKDRNSSGSIFQGNNLLTGLHFLSSRLKKERIVKEMSCGRLNASWKISSSAVDGQSFLVIDGSLLN